MATHSTNPHSAPKTWLHLAVHIEVGVGPPNLHLRICASDTGLPLAIVTVPTLFVDESNTPSYAPPPY